MKKIKISYLGGGSKAWARIFMVDLALTSNLCGEIALYDIDIPSAILNQKIGEQINKNPKTISKWEYKVYEQIDDALAAADFVIISILPGSFKEMRSDVHAPENYGIYQSVGDTVGPGGVLRSMRTVPIFEGFAQKIKEICPNAWVINLTNPMSICVKTLYDVFPKIKAFGCCHEVFHTQDFLCSVLKEEKNIEVTRHDIVTNVTGINHFTWINEAKYQDIDILGLLPNFMEKYFESGHNEKGPVDEYKFNPFAYANRVKMDLFKRYGVLGAAGDRHLVEFMNQNWYLKDKDMIDKWKFALTTVDFRIKRQDDKLKESILISEGKKTIKLNRSNEEAVELMKAILGFGDIISNVNLPNTGQIKEFPIGAIVESNACFKKDQVTPLSTQSLPIGPMNLILQNLYNMEELYQGIKNRNLELIFSSFLHQPLCSNLTVSEAKKLFTEMMEKTREYLDPYYAIDAFRP